MESICVLTTRVLRISGFASSIFACHALHFAQEDMMAHLRRRRFVQLAGTATAAGALGACGRRGSPWHFLRAADGKTLEALCEQIIPSDQTPGAAWAGVVNYIDRQLMGPFR